MPFYFYANDTINAMRKEYILLVLVFVLGLAACKKDNKTPNAQIAGIEFTLFDLRALGDTIALEVNYPSTFILKNDYSWSLDINGTKSSGTYTWKPTSNQQAEVKFSITQWTDFSANLTLSNKLKSALLAVKSCGYSLQAPSYANFLDLSYQGSYFPFLRTNKK